MRLVEFVARAIADEMKQRDNAFVSAQRLDNVRIEGHFNLVEVAEVALEAMRMPTAAMIAAAERLDEPGPRGARATPEEHWSAMIDAALAESRPLD